MTTREFPCPFTRIPLYSKDDNTIKMNVDGDGQEVKSDEKKNSSISSRGTCKKRENISRALVSLMYMLRVQRREMKFFSIN